MNPEENVAIVPLEKQAGTLSVYELGPLRAPEELEKLEQTGQALALACRAVAASEAEWLQQAMEQGGVYPPLDAAERFTREHLAYVGLVAGEGEEASGHPTTIACYGWVTLTFQAMGESGWMFKAPIGDAYLYDFATLPQYRGRGYYPALLRYIVADLAKQDIGRAWIGTAPGNDVSARSIARAGFQKVADVTAAWNKLEQRVVFDLLPIPGVSQELVESGRQSHVLVQP